MKTTTLAFVPFLYNSKSAVGMFEDHLGVAKPLSSLCDQTYNKTPFLPLLLPISLMGFLGQVSYPVGLPKPWAIPQLYEIMFWFLIQVLTTQRYLHCETSICTYAMHTIGMIFFTVNVQ